MIDGDSDSADALIALETVAAVHPVLRDLAHAAAPGGATTGG